MAPAVGGESADSRRAVAELQMKNAGLQEQLCVQKQLLREKEVQLQESQRSCAQLRTQVTSGGPGSAYLSPGSESCYQPLTPPP